MEIKNYCHIERVENLGFSNTKMTKPIDKDDPEEFESLESKSQIVIIDEVKYHLIHHLA